MKKAFLYSFLLAVLVFMVSPVYAQDDLAKATQNPVSDLISLPFQNNTNFQVGPYNKTQNVLNIQPVWPVSLNEKWNLITRTILPVISQPELVHGNSRTNGLGDLNFTAFFSPVKPGALTWGVGPIIVLPTATDDVLGTKKWSIGASVVALKMSGPWVYGALLNNITSFAGDSDRTDVNQMLLQPFINFNMPESFYFTSAPIITANWEAGNKDRWTVPIGGGFGKILKFDNQPVNISFQMFYNVKSPRNGPDWTSRVQVQLLFPK